MSKYNKWELWWAYYKFEDSDELKHRPVLVDEDGDAYAIAYKVTSHEPRHDSLEYEIINWVSAGLSKESTVRLSQKIKIPASDMDKYIGKLHIIDIMRIENLLS